MTMDVHGIKSGAAILRMEPAEEGFLVLRVLTFSAAGQVTITDVDLAPSDARRMLDVLAAAFPERLAKETA